jgi:hypothetical protein
MLKKNLIMSRKTFFTYLAFLIIVIIGFLYFALRNPNTFDKDDMPDCIIGEYNPLDLVSNQYYINTKNLISDRGLELDSSGTLIFLYNYGFDSDEEILTIIELTKTKSIVYFKNRKLEEFEIIKINETNTGKLYEYLDKFGNTSYLRQLLANDGGMELIWVYRDNKIKNVFYNENCIIECEHESDISLYFSEFVFSLLPERLKKY